MGPGALAGEKAPCTLLPAMGRALPRQRVLQKEPGKGDVFGFCVAEERLAGRKGRKRGASSRPCFL